METGNNVFLFEYATCSSQPLPSSIRVEGLGMFKTLYDGFENPISFYRATDYLGAFKEKLEKAEFALAIAPETDMELHRLTKLVEGSDCRNLGSNSKAVKRTSDKLLTYKRLKELSPRTELFKGKTDLDFPIIAKPRDGVSCEGLMKIENEKELKKVPEEYLIQKYIEGRPMSASIIVGDDVQILSINTQEIIDFEYLGSKLPISLSNFDPIIEAVHRFPGLFGYLGVDFILVDGAPVIIEINPRPTTPIIGIKKSFGYNISKIVLDNYNGKHIEKKMPKRAIQIKKTRGNSGFVSLGGYSIKVEEIHEDTGP
jgi:predicted ATP-grasp superfamily ATP-dependent carboligase